MNLKKSNKKYEKIYDILNKTYGNKDFAYFYYNEIEKFFNFKDKERYNAILFSCLNDYQENILEIKYKNFEKKKNIKNLEIIGLGGYGQIYKIDENTCFKIVLEKEENNYMHEFNIPRKISEFKNCKDLIVVPEVLIINCIFNGLLNIIQYNVVFFYLTFCYLNKFPINENNLANKLKYLDITNEFNLIYENKNEELSKKSDSFLNFLYNEYLEEDEKYIEIRYLKKIIKGFKKKNDDLEIVDKGILIALPLLEGCSNNLYLDNSLKINYQRGHKAQVIYKNYCRMLFLQTMLILLKINEKIKFTHNDLKPDNILVSKFFKEYKISYKNLNFVFNEKFRFKLADFDFSIIEGFDNKKINKTKISLNSSWLSDVHFFIHNMFYYFTENKSNKNDYDEDFFNELYEYFIVPFCDSEKSDLQNISTINTKKCFEGRLNINYDKDISYLTNFIKKDLFDFWRVKN